MAYSNIQRQPPFSKVYLLVLDGLGELVSEGKVGDRHVVHDEVELLRAVGQLVANAGADGLTLAQQFLGVVLGHHGLQHLRLLTPWARYDNTRECTQKH